MSKTFETPKLPEVKFNKNGYEIRADILGMAKDYVTEDFQTKFAGWQMTAGKDKDGQLVTTVSMPQFPGLETILETAERMYSFVNQGVTSIKK
jgi:hypothetical protein